MNLENFNSELRKFFDEPEAEAEKRNKGKAIINQLIEDIRDNDWYCIQYWGESNLHEWEKALLVAGLKSLLMEGEDIDVQPFLFQSHSYFPPGHIPKITCGTEGEE